MQNYICSSARNNPVTLRCSTLTHQITLWNPFFHDTLMTRVVVVMHSFSFLGDSTENGACYKIFSGCCVGGKVPCNVDSHETVMSSALCAVHHNLFLENNILSSCTELHIEWVMHKCYTEQTQFCVPWIEMATDFTDSWSVEVTVKKNH